MAFTYLMAPPPQYTTFLSRPVVVPQTAAGRGQAFLRAWAPVLEPHGFTKTDFVAFIDNLNVVATKNPPLQVLDLVGGVVGMVPYHWFQIAGAATQATAKFGTAVVSKTRTDMYLKKINEQLFKPRGLKVSIASYEALRSLLKVPISQPAVAPLTRETIDLSIRERVLRPLLTYCAELDLDIPKPAEQTTIMAKWSAKQVESNDKKIEKKAMKQREKAVRKDEKRERKAERRERKRERKGGKLKAKDDSSSSSSESGDSGSGNMVPRNEKGIEGGKRDMKGKTKKDKEAKRAERLLWIVIENL